MKTRTGGSRQFDLGSIALVIFAAALAGGLGEESSAWTPTRQTNVDRDAEAILNRARKWVGGESLKRVRTLTLIRSEGPRGQTLRPHEVRLMLPDRFQSRPEGGWVHTLDGARFWMTVAPGFETAFTTEMRTTAERNTLVRFVREAMTFLLQVPDGHSISVTAAGRITLQGIAGDGVRVSLLGRGADTFVFDAGEGRPIGCVREPTGSAEPRVDMFLDYRPLEGVRFPYRLQTQYLNGGAVLESNVTAIKINDLTIADFRAGSK